MEKINGTLLGSCTQVRYRGPMVTRVRELSNVIVSPELHSLYSLLLSTSTVY